MKSTAHMARRISVLLAIFAALLLAAAPLGAAHAQPADSTVTEAARSEDASSSEKNPSEKKRVGLAVQEALFANVVVNRFNAWALGEGWARDVNAETWSRNLRLGWEWDEDRFSTNMFAHPYQGSFYFNAGRANGLSYWESVPLSFLGSWTWEHFGETYRPSLNDFFMTSFGGASVGEMAHRVSATIRDEQAGGAERLLRETAALFVNPVEGVSRLLRGEWTGRRPNPAEHRPEALFLGANVGVRSVYEVSSDDGTDDDSAGDGLGDVSPTLLVDLSYGDAFGRPYSKPFDVFSVLAQFSPGGGGLNALQTTGRLYQTGLPWSRGERARHAFSVDQHFDYLSNPVYRYGAQSVEAGIRSRFALPGGLSLRTRLAGSALFMGALSAPPLEEELPGADPNGEEGRTYDFGPGVGAVVSAALVRGRAYLALYNRGVYLHSLSGTPADHLVGFTGLKGNLPLAGGLGVGFYLSGDARASRYADRPEIDRQFVETRLFISWSSARRPTDPQVR